MLRSDGSLRINARLVDTQALKTLWSDRFDVDRADILRTQDEIVTRLASTLHGELVQAETRRSTTTMHRTSTRKIWRCSARRSTYRLGYAGMPNYELCERALSIDPRNVRALVQLATYYGYRGVARAKPRLRGRPGAANVLVTRALEIDPGYYAAHCAKATVLEGNTTCETA